jgi:hypothetical protein
MSGIDGIQDVYEFDVSKEAWTKLKQNGEVPKPRDDHSLAQIDDERFIIFGGFVDGTRTNECYICTKQNNTLHWKQVGANSPEAPCIRASHSAAVFNGKMYIFGGQDDENNKLKDLWEFDIMSETFRQVDLPDDSYHPSPRSGHSATVFKGKMLIFGGILELTKELNDLLAFDFKSMKFQLIGTQQVYQDEHDIAFNAHHKPAEHESPHHAKGNINTSPMKGTNRKSMYPGANFSPKKTQKAKPKANSPKKETDKQESRYLCHTSNQMQNSFIIKNADESFDAYYA